MIPKSVMRPINNKKNKLNKKIIYNFNLRTNAHVLTYVLTYITMQYDFLSSSVTSFLTFC